MSLYKIVRSKIFFPIVLLLSVSCGPVENSATSDKSKFGPPIDITGSTPLFASVRASLTKCQNCHGNWLSLTESQFVSTGLVVKGSPEGSQLYFRNQLAMTGPGPKNMPTMGYPAMTSAEIQTMIDWINGL